MGNFTVIGTLLALGLPAVVLLAWTGRSLWVHGRFDYRIRRQLAGIAFVIPAYALFAFIILIPTAGTVAVSLQVPQDEFAVDLTYGVRNYRNLLLRDPMVWEAFTNNTFYLIATLVVEVFAGLVLAILLARDRPGFTFFRLLFFTPMMLSMVVVGLLWKIILRADDGLVNQLLTHLGLEGWEKTAWLAHPLLTLPAICLISGWIYVGFYLVLFHAAIRRIPDSLFECARLDGCSELQVSRYVILPLLRDVGTVCVLICATGAFKAFDLFFVMSPSGLNHTEMVATYLVKEILDNRNPYYGSTIAVFMTVVVLLITLIVFRFQKRSETLEF